MYHRFVFRREGPGRDVRSNSRIASYLALIAGFVNSAGLILLGTFTSHVTGNVGRMSYDLAIWDRAASSFAFLLVASFFVGAFGASLIIEGSTERMHHAYGWALLLQSGLLLAFAILPGIPCDAAMLCAAMGMQNSLVTRLSGAVVRTTHLTGIVTDLGIEAARWYRWRRQQTRLPLLLRGRIAPTRPSAPRTMLLVTIALAFFVGAIAGSVGTLWARHWAMIVPAGLTLALSLYAFHQVDVPNEAPDR